MPAGVCRSQRGIAGYCPADVGTSAGAAAPVFGDGWPKPPFGTGLVVSGMDGALSVQVCVHLVFKVEIIKMKINLQYLACCIYVFLLLTLKVRCACKSDRSVHAPLCGSLRIRMSGATVFRPRSRSKGIACRRGYFPVPAVRVSAAGAAGLPLVLLRAITPLMMNGMATNRMVPPATSAV